MEKIKNSFATSDIKITTFLLCSGIPLQKLVKDDPRKIVFCFEDEEAVSKVISSYWSNEAMVDPKQLFDCWDYLKKLIHGDF